MRRRRPAYARALARQRDDGRHPWRVWVLYGDDWGRRPRSEPSVCVGDDYAPGSVDWGVVAGVRVDVVWRGGADPGPLLGDLARVAAPVYLCWKAGAEDWPCPAGSAQRFDVADIAAGSRVTGLWPSWWSDELEADYRARRDRRFAAELADAHGALREAAA